MLSAHTTANAPPVTPRNLRFESDRDDVPRYWHPGGRAVTTFLDNLSVFFPLGERFFVRSVRAHEKHVTDPALREQVRGFHGQEGMHSREHARYNEALASRGYPVADMERRVAGILKLAERVLPPSSRLAATCALEHMTAMLAHMLLSDPRLLEGAHPVMAELWRWHAAEEIEHRAVAFDVLRASGVSYPERAGLMVIASTIFVAKVLEQQVRMMHRDGIALSLREWRGLARFLFVEPGGRFKVLRGYFEYYRPGFHPSSIGGDELVARWREELERAAEYGRRAA